MPASTKLATSWRLQVPTVWQESTTSSRGLARPFCRDMRTKLVKSRLTHKETRSSRPVRTKLADFGQLRREMKYSVLERTRAKVTKMKYSLVRLTTRVIQSLQDPKITLAVSGKTSV